MASLRKNLGVFGAVAISLAVMGPSMSVSLNPQAIASQVGTAVPSAFLLAAIPLALIAGSFVLLSRRGGSAGSVFGLVGKEIGPRSGTAAGLWLVAAYVAAAAITSLSFGIFTTTLLQEYGWASAPSWFPILLAFLILPVTAFLAGRTMRTLGRVLLILEGITMVAIVSVCGVALYTLINGGGPQGQTVEWSAFRIDGVTGGAIALALTFALLSSAGFEGSAAAGEEMRDAKRDIPNALIWTTVVTSIFFVFVSMVAIWAFGTSSTELKSFISSGSLPSDIANAYVSDAVGDLVTFGVAVSSFACMIGAQVAGGRILFSFARSGVIPHRLATLSTHGTPATASLVVSVCALLFVVFAAIVTAGTPFSAFEMTSDVAGVVFIGAYASACAAAVLVLWRSERGRAWAILPMVGIIVLLIVLVLQLFPLPSGWELVAPVVGVVVLVGGALVGRVRGNRASATFGDERPTGAS